MKLIFAIMLGAIAASAQFTPPFTAGGVSGGTNLTTVGAVPYVSATGVLNQDATVFFWDAANNRLGIGTNAPATSITVQQSANTVANGIRIIDSTGNTSLNLWTSSGTVNRIDGGGTGADILSLQGAGTGKVGIGTTAPGSTLSVNGRASANLFGSETNCSSSAGPAVCAAAPAGSVIIPAAGTDVTVNTTAVTANSQIFAIFDQSLGTKLGVTCNSTTANPHIGARVAGTSFTIHSNVSPITNPACFSYFIIN